MLGGKRKVYTEEMVEEFSKLFQVMDINDVIKEMNKKFNSDFNRFCFYKFKSEYFPRVKTYRQIKQEEVYSYIIENYKTNSKILHKEVKEKFKEYPLQLHAVEKIQRDAKNKARMKKLQNLKVGDLIKFVEDNHKRSGRIIKEYKRFYLVDCKNYKTCINKF